MTNEWTIKTTKDALELFLELRDKVVLGPVQVYQVGNIIRIDINEKGMK